jgi:hypothetical protein
LQHTPSTHCPEAHCDADVQGAPSPWSSWHVPSAARHQDAAAHPASSVQNVAHATGSAHAYGLHDVVDDGRQAPAPLHARIVSAPDEQAVPHVVPAGNSAHAPVPLHAPVVAHDDAG